MCLECQCKIYQLCETDFLDWTLFLFFLNFNVIHTRNIFGVLIDFDQELLWVHLSFSLYVTAGNMSQYKRAWYAFEKLRYLLNTFKQIIDLASFSKIHLAIFYNELDSLRLDAQLKFSKCWKNAFMRELLRMLDCQFFNIYAKFLLVALRHGEPYHRLRCALVCS